MSRIELTGLRGDLPIGAMAAFGVLRICSRHERFMGAKLCWSGEGGDYRAALVTENDLNTDDLIEALVEDAGRPTELPDWQQVKNLTRDEFRGEAHLAACAASPDNHERADWIACLASELGREEKLESTPFDTTGGPQKFLRVRLSAMDLSRDKYKEALVGPWKYRDDQHSLGWDSSTIRLGAFTHEDPSPMKKSGVRAAVWLAFEGLALFPCFYAYGLRTRGFVQVARDVTLFWPIWKAPIDIQELATLLAWGPLYTKEPNRAEMRSRGVMAVFRSQRFSINKYFKAFRPPELAYSE